MADSFTKFIWQPYPTHKAYIYTQFEKFLNLALWELHEIEKKILRKINALRKKRSLHNMFFENPVPLNLALTNYDKAYICHY